MATVVQDEKMSTPTQDELFEGKIFWLSLGVPMRSTIVNLIKVGYYEPPGCPFSN